MTKGQRAGETPIGVNVQSNLFVMDHIKILYLSLCHIKLINLKKFFSAPVNRLMINQCAMDHITLNNYYEKY